MALLLNKTAQWGVMVTYFSVDQVNIFWGTDGDKTAHVVIRGYRSEETKKNDHEIAVIDKYFDFNSGNWPFIKGGNSEQEFYDWLKTKIAEESEKPEEKQDANIMFFAGYEDAI